MEKELLDEGYTLVISERLAEAGYQEMMIRGKDRIIRQVVVPQTFHLQKLVLPQNIVTLVGTPFNSGYSINIPADSIPVSILDFEKQETSPIKYPGLVSDLQASIQRINDDNPNLISLLDQFELAVEDLLTVSINETQITILI